MNSGSCSQMTPSWKWPIVSPTPTFIFRFVSPLSLCYSVTLLLGYVVTLLHCHPVTLLPCYLVTLLLCSSVPLFLCSSVPLFLCSSVPLLPCYSVTLLLCYPVNLTVICYSVTLLQTCQLSRFSRESPSFSSNLPGLPDRAWNLPGNTYRGLFQIFSLNSSFSRCEKGKEEVD